MIAEQKQHYHFSVDDYYAMAANGILKPDSSIELIEGEILEMPPIGSKHSHIVNLLLKKIVKQLPDKYMLGCQSPLRLSDFSEPEPDLIIYRTYEGMEERHPEPRDTLLVIEVADTSLEYDQKTKLPLYASHNIPEVWIINVAKREIELYTNPKGNNYADMHRINSKENLVPSLVDDCLIEYDNIFSS